MLLKDAANVVQSKFDEEFERMDLSEMTKFEFAAIKMKTQGGYIIVLYANQKTVAIISSKRVERRVFKTLEAVSKALSDVGITRFEVIG